MSIIAHGIAGTPSGTTLTTAPADTTGAGLLIVALSSVNSTYGTTPTVSDSKGNTWTALTAKVGVYYRECLYCCLAPTVGTGHTFSCDHAGANPPESRPTLAFLAASGTYTAGAENGNHIDAGSSSVQPGSVTPAVDGSLVVTGLLFGDASSATIDSGFAADTINTGSDHLSAAIGWLEQGTAAAVNPTWSWGGGDTPVTTIAAFEPVGGDTTPPTLGTGTVPTGGVTLTATLSESGCTPASGTGGFTLGGTTATVASWAISGTTLTLTLSSTVYSGETVTLSYSRAATTDDIADAAGNFLADFSAAAVTNSSTQVATTSYGALAPQGDLRMLRNTAGQKLVVFAYTASTRVPIAGDAANLSAFVSRDYATPAALADTSAAELSASNATGFYLFDLAQAETDADVLTFTAKSTTSGVVAIAVPAVVGTDAVLTSVDANVTGWKGGTPGDLASGRVPSALAFEVTLVGGTVATGSSTTSFTATVSGSTLSSTTGAYDGMKLLFQSGALSGEAGVISTYTVTGGTATFTFVSGQAFSATPGTGDTFVVG